MILLGLDDIGRPIETSTMLPIQKIKNQIGRMKNFSVSWYFTGWGGGGIDIQFECFECFKELVVLV